MGLKAGSSILDRWKLDDGTFKYRELCCKGSNPIALERDFKLLAVLMADLFRVDATRDVKENYETDLLRTDGRPLAFFNDKTMYSKLGMLIWTDFWLAGSNFGHISRLLRANERDAIDRIAEGTFHLYA